MIKLYQNFLMAGTLVCMSGNLSAQCASTTPLGSASNMFTLIRNGNNPIAANKALNTIAFIHRNNAGALGGNSGQLRYDKSTNAGATWTLDVGVINQGSTYLARYPNMALYNPTGNTNPNNSYLSYLVPCINVSSAWVGVISGVTQFNLGGMTETYNQNGLGAPAQIPHSLVNGAPGVFWAIEPSLNAASANYYIYKGVWNNGLSDIDWNVNYTMMPPYLTGFFVTPAPDYNIGFDPTGQIGYASVMANLNIGSTNAALNLVLYKTTNGGNTWTGPILVDMSKLGCISSNTVSGFVPSANTEHDLVVDVNGTPHLITTLGSASNYVMNYSVWHHMYDITMKNGVWIAHDMGNTNGSPYVIGVGAETGTVTQAPQAARTADGSKVFFTWADNSSYTLGQVNNQPNLFAKAYDVVQNKWTPTKDFTSCNVATAGKMLFPHMAPEVLEPSANVYKMAVMYGECSVAGDVTVTANFKFLDNVTFAAADFSITPPTATISIPQGPNILLCQNSSVTINVTTTVGTVGEAIWSNGANSTTLSVSSGTATSYSVATQAGCNYGTASVTVANMTLNAGASGAASCPGNPATFTVSGNAFGYTWTPGSITGSNVTLNPTTSPVTITALGSGSCTMTQAVSVNLLPQPTVAVAGSTTLCDGHSASLVASGAASYLWDDGSTTAAILVSPTQNTVYTVIGTAANSCTNTQSFSITIIPSPTVTAITNQPSICVGGTAVVNALGANSYTWEPGTLTTNPSMVTPIVTTIYSVTGIGPNLCTTTKTVEVVVHPLPTLSITPSRTLWCKGEKGTLLASGAATYTWTNPVSSNVSVQVTPTVTTVYTLLGKSAPGCTSTYTFSLVASPCTGIGEHNTGDLLQLYPNPNNGSFSIKSGYDLQVQIVSETGQLVKTLFVEAGGDVQVDGLAAGVYFVVGSGEEGTARFKVIVQK